MVVLGGNNSFKFAEQAWHRSGRCPEGSIPIRRTPATATADANRTLHFFSSYGRPPPNSIHDEAGNNNYNLEVSNNTTILPPSEKRKLNPTPSKIMNLDKGRPDLLY